MRSQGPGQKYWGPGAPTLGQAAREGQPSFQLSVQTPDKPPRDESRVKAQVGCLESR